MATLGYIKQTTQPFISLNKWYHSQRLPYDDLSSKDSLTRGYIISKLQKTERRIKSIMDMALLILNPGGGLFVISYKITWDTVTKRAK